MKKSKLIEELRRKWESLLRPLDVDEALATELFDDLVARYEEDGRHYHTLTHLGNVLAVVDQLGPLAHDLTAVRLAAWYHDAVYDMQMGDNEAQSAAYAGKVLARIGIDKERSAAIQQMILATEVSNAPPPDIDSQILLDADLATLASDPEQYDANSRAIRREYAFVPEEDYRRGRIAVLEGFLQRDRIFFTDAMYEQREQQARENLRREIGYLS